MTTNSAGIIIAAGGPSLSPDFYWQLFGAATWNPEQVAVANSDNYALAYMPLMVASIIVSALSSPAGRAPPIRYDRKLWQATGTGEKCVWF